MADTNLQATRTSLLTALGISLNWGDDPDVWMLDSAYAARGQKCIDFGLSRFYNGELLPNERVVWKWSFLTPIFDFSLTDGTTLYDLPDDFNGFIKNELNYSPDTRKSWYPLSLVSLPRLQKERQIYTGRVGAPTMAAVYPVAGDGSEGQRWKLDVFPEPDADYDVLGQYYSNPYQITGLKPYPLGGQYSSVALECAVCAAGELIINGNPAGPYETQFKRSYLAAVHHDRQYVAAQKKMGMNYDQGRLESPYVRSVLPVTYNDVEYNG